MAKEEGKELIRTEERPAGPLTPFRDIDRWFDDFFARPFAFPRVRMTAMQEIIPDVDIYESDGDLILKAELPGMKKEDIEVTLSDGSITLSGEKKQEEEIKKKDYYKVERSYGSFRRTFSLPTDVKADKAKSTFKDGVLEVRIPKSEEAKSKEVKVKIE